MTAAENTARLGAEDASSRSAAAARATAFGVLFAASGSHMLNDMMQSLAPALYPVFRDQLSLTFFLDLDVREGLERAAGPEGHDRIEAESLLFHENVRGPEYYREEAR